MKHLNHHSSKIRTGLLCAGSVLVLGLASTSSASVLVNADFSGTGYTAGASLSGQSGASDVGLAGTFNTFPVASYNSGLDHSADQTVVTATGVNDLTYNIVGGGTISSTNVLQSTYVGGLQQVFGRDLSSAISGQTVYARVLVKGMPTSNNSGTIVNWFMTDQSQVHYPFYSGFGTGLGQYTTNFVASIGGQNAGVHTTGPAVSDNTVNLLVAAFNWDAVNSKYDSVSFWLNPAFGDSGTPLATASISAANGNASLGQIGLDLGNIAHVSPLSNPVYDFGSFRVGTQWSDVVIPSVPEPASLSMGLLGLGLLAGCRRRKRPNL